MRDTIKVILPAGQIPLGATVTNRTGRKEYVLQDPPRMFPTPNASFEAQVIKAELGVRFLVNDGDANAIPNDLELVWFTTRDSLRYWLDPPTEK